MGLKISAITVPHGCQRYDTVGDYFEDGDILNFRISDMGNNYMEWLVLLHEMIEYLLATKKGISIEDIDKSDLDFIKNNPNSSGSEAGDDPNSIIYREHQIATSIEHLLATELDVNWQEYDKKVMELK